MNAKVNERPCANCQSADHTRRYEVVTDLGGLFHVVECRSCGLVRLLENLSEAEYLDLYGSGSAAGTTRRVTRPNLADELTLRSYDRILGDLEGYRRTGKLLEVGVGGGSFLCRAAEQGWTCYGNDVSSVSFDPLYEVIPAANLFRGFLHDAPFFETIAPMDVCVMLGVLEHIPAPVDLLSTLRDMLRPGGAIFIDVPNYAALSRRILGANWGMWDVPSHVSFFTPSTLEGVLTMAGFNVRRHWTSGFNPVDLGRAFRRRRSTVATACADAARAEVGSADAETPAYRAGRVARRGRTNRIRRIVSHLGPAKQIINAGLDAISGGDSLYCLAERL